MTRYIPSRLIEKKRGGEELTERELGYFFGEYLKGKIPDYQMAAFLMAVYFQGLGTQELEALLELMIHSGDVLDFSSIPAPKVDKHSTGGVGDKTSLVLAPLAAELGLAVPMMSGRGLGHTAGTLDKLEAIPGFRTQLTVQEVRSVLEDVGVAMMGQTRRIAPLDRKLYALRDSTATVPSIPLVAASIMSKKLAEGLQGLVLDVKTGSGAFLAEQSHALTLARTMVELGEARGLRTTALMTNMDVPLGLAIGNSLETREALECLQGKGPPDLADLTVALVGEMLFLGTLAETPEAGEKRAREALEQGRAVSRMARLVERQGGDPAIVEHPDRLPRAPEIRQVNSEDAGFVGGVSPKTLGYGVVELGGGRCRSGDPIDLRVGFILKVRLGDRIEPGDPLGEVHAANEADLRLGESTLRDAIRIMEDPPGSPGPLVLKKVGSGGP